MSAPESNNNCATRFVIPAKAGTQLQLPARPRADWVPAFAGKTKLGFGCAQGDAFARKVTVSGDGRYDPMVSATIGTIRCR
jgi:hypothetical protein